MKASQKNLTYLLIYFILFIKPFALCSETQSKDSFLVYKFSSGMFATFSAVLGALYLYDIGYLAGIKIDMDNGTYLDPMLGPNWWEYFFEQIILGNDQAPKHISTLEDHLAFAYHGFTLPNERAFELIQKYIHIKPNILEEVDKFVNQHFIKNHVIGVHYRGTDKKMETPLVPYEKTCQTIDNYIQTLKTNYQEKNFKIFVATDDQNFLDYILKLYPGKIVYNDFVRSSDETPLHYGNDHKYQSIYQKGREALIDCLLLSKCHILIRPSSCLSMMAANFNPKMPVIILQGYN